MTGSSSNARSSSSPVERLFAALEGNQRRTLALGLGGILIIALIDSIVLSNVSLGFLHVIPVVVLATAIRKWQVVVVAVLCSLLREWLSPFAFEAGYVARMVVVTLVLAAAGLLVAQVQENLKILARQVALEREHNESQRAASEHLRVLVDTCPLGILVADGQGKLLLANDHARSLFELGEDWNGLGVAGLIPPLTNVLASREAAGAQRTELECRARRRNGEEFLAHVWFSRWNHDADARLQAVVWDASGEVADREAGTLRALMMTSQVLVAAFAHEVRNLAGAARKMIEVHERRGEGMGRESLEAVGNLLESLEKLGSARLTAGEPGRHPLLNLHTLMDHAHTLVEDLLAGSDVRLEWDVPAGLGKARAESSALLQVFLNIVNNARAAVQGLPDPRIAVTARRAGEKFTVRLQNSGPYVAEADRLFQPMRSEAPGTGLGLYISRALVRAFGGNLYYEAAADGPAFVVEIPAERAE